jgi:signal transduction histidine kinase
MCREDQRIGLAGVEIANISLQKQLAAGLPEITGDPMLLTQAVYNILSNAKWAIKSNPYGTAGTILISTQAMPGGGVELTVSDNGIGVPPGILPKVFEPFFTTKPDALGLGLTVARRIVNDLKGDINVSSEEGKGAVVRIAIPSA